jgi:hypothetical protein
MKYWLFIYLFWSFSSYGQIAKLPFEEGTENYIRLKKDIELKLKKWNTQGVNTGDFDIKVNPLIQGTNSIGVYNYFAVGSHHSGKNFFIYDGKTIKILNPSDTTTFKSEVAKFLTKNKFSSEQEKDFFNKVDKILFRKDSSSF